MLVMRLMGKEDTKKNYKVGPGRRGGGGGGMVFNGFQRTKHLCGLNTRYKPGAMEAQVSFLGARAWLNIER